MSIIFAMTKMISIVINFVQLSSSFIFISSIRTNYLTIFKIYLAFTQWVWYGSFLKSENLFSKAPVTRQFHICDKSFVNDDDVAVRCWQTERNSAFVPFPSVLVSTLVYQGVVISVSLRVMLSVSFIAKKTTCYCVSFKAILHFIFKWRYENDELCM